MTKVYNKLNLRACMTRLIGFALLLTLILLPEQAHAQWPPFKFGLIPSYESDQITYQIRFSSEVEWPMSDVALKIPLPRGTRFLEASAPPWTQVEFDGKEVTFFTSFLARTLKDTFFVVEVTDPVMTVFTTHAWIAWQGDQPGDYLTEEVSLDITQPALPWEKPARSRVRLEAKATVADGMITYALYPTNVTKQRIWDLKVNVPLPEGTTFVSAEAPAPFVAGFDGREVSFSVVELVSQAEVGPLTFKVSTEDVTAPFVVTYAWASWKNVGRKVGQSLVAQEGTRSGDIVVQPHPVQQVVSDRLGDVPFSNYDLTSLALQEEGSALKVSFYTAGSLGPMDEPLQYIFYIDSDCRADTGGPRKGLGLEYRMRYKHDKGQADLSRWESANGAEAGAEIEVKGSWHKVGLIEDVSGPVDGQMVTMRIPYDLLDLGQQFCWLVEAHSKSKVFATSLPKDWMLDDKDLRLTQYDVLGPAPVASTEPLTSTPVYYGNNNVDD